MSLVKHILVWTIDGSTDRRCFASVTNERALFFFFSMDIISPDLDSFRAAAVGVGVW